jgi:hypothetical protein
VAPTTETDAESRRHERTKRVAAANRVLAHYRMNLADWQGSAFVLSSATGKTEIVDNLAHLWIAAERLLGRPCDPLNEADDAADRDVARRRGVGVCRQ